MDITVWNLLCYLCGPPALDLSVTYQKCYVKLITDIFKNVSKMTHFHTIQVFILLQIVHTWKILLPSLFKIITHWSKWWCSIVLVVYKIARGDSILLWKALFVPRWSKSWHKQATSKPNICKNSKNNKNNVFHYLNIPTVYFWTNCDTGIEIVA